MKTKRLAFILVLTLFVVTISVGSTPEFYNDSSTHAIRLITTSQISGGYNIVGNSDLAIVSTSGVGTRNDPYIIEGLTITSDRCIRIVNTDAFFVIRDSEFTYDANLGGTFAVEFSNVEHGTIENCFIRGGEAGIMFSSASDCHVINCETYEAYDGILLENSNNCTVVDSTSFGNTIGVMLANSDFCNIINNSIYSNSERGIHLEAFSENNTIAGNEVGWNIIWNILDNGLYTVYQDGIVFGNRWSDYNESEAYVVPGTGGTTDFFADSLIDISRPYLIGLLDTVIDVESSDSSLTWNASDYYHHQYHISIDGELVETGIWDSRPITFDISNLNVGTYIIVLTVIDGAGNSATDEVSVSVISFILGGIGTELVMLASGVTVVCFVIIMVIIKRLS